MGFALDRDNHPEGDAVMARLASLVTVFQLILGGTETNAKKSESFSEYEG